jgi:protein TonB
MFDRMLVSRRDKVGLAALRSFPAAMSLHLLALVALIAGSWLSVPQVDDPAWPPLEIRIALPPPPPPPPPPRGSLAPAAARLKPERPRPPEEVVQPAAVPERALEAVAAADVPAGSAGGVEGGVDGGVQGGMPGGVEGGVEGGVLGGTPGGVPGALGGDRDAGPVTWTPSMRLPVAIHRVEPAYPEIARVARQEGSVELAVVIGTDGRVEEVQVVRGNAMFEREAIEAVRQWRFLPTILDGRAVKILYRIQIDFHLR